MMHSLLQLVIFIAFPLLSTDETTAETVATTEAAVTTQATAGGCFKLCQFETGHRLVLEPGAQYVARSAVTVRYDKESGIVWCVDETTGTLKTQINHLCVRQRQGGKRKLELRECDGMNDWRLICPNDCRTVDDSLRHFIASPANDRVAVWGDHEAIWTGAGRAGLKLLMQMELNPSKSILVGRSYQDFYEDFGTKWKKC